jgi:SAM-dependent methyltransferase
MSALADTYLTLCAKWVDSDGRPFTLLDLGCRTMELKSLLRGCTSYVGTDLLSSTPDVVSCDLNQPLPFASKSFDVVTCLEVLEHLDKPHQALGEALRVARRSVYISLPNMYHFRFRIAFLSGFLSNKYRFHPDPVLDRHKWIMSYDEAVRFVDHNSRPHKVTHAKTIVRRVRTRAISTPIERRFAERWPNLFARELVSRIDICS